MPEELEPAVTNTESSSEPSVSRSFGDFLDEPENYFSDGKGGESDSDDEPAGNDAAVEATSEESQQPNSYDVAIFKGIKNPEVRNLMEAIAESDDLDLNNPKDFKLARRVAESQVQIRELKKAGEPAADVKDYLDAFNDPEPQVAAETPQQDSQASDENLPDFVKIARGWKQPADFTKSLYGAFDMDEGPEKDKAVADVMGGFIDRAFHEMYLPRIQHIVEQLQQAKLGPVVSEVQEAQAMRERKSIVDRMAAMPETQDIMTLFDPASDGELEIEGESVPDTWINRVLIANPFILKINVKGRTPAETLRKTTAEQYRVAHQLMKSLRAPKADPLKEKNLVRVGQAIERTKRDQTRTGLNSPGSRIPAGGRAPSIFADGRSGKGLTMADL